MADHELARTLSARYYLPGRILPNPQVQSGQDCSVDMISSQSYVHSQSVSTTAISNRVRKRGRPMMSPRTDTASHDRRTQIRHAQRTYRKKKETMLREMKGRVSELQDTVDRISASLADFHEMAIQSDLHVTHPYLFDKLNETIAQVQNETPPEDGDLDLRQTAHQATSHATHHPATITQTPDPATFGYTISPGAQQDLSSQPPISRERHRPVRFCHPLYTYHMRHIEKPLSGSSSHTHSFHETDFSRRLQRYCTEYVWRIFIDPHANPQEFYRLFRLVPCVRYSDKMRPYLECLVRSGTHESLDIAATPFYCIGGAGTHYPRRQNGTPVYPENMRLPRKILSLLPSSDVRDDKTSSSTDDRDALLKSLGLHGIWLDCHDVQGYLEEKGLSLDGPSCVSASGSGSAASQIPDRVDKENTMDVDVQKEDGVIPAKKFHAGDDGKSKNSRTSDLTLNVEEFFRLLLKNMIILGRAPGFRLNDVETAFKSAVKLSSN